MIETSVETVADSSAPTITPETPVSEAAELLRDPTVDALVVLDVGTVVGIVTESDVVAMVAETDERPPVGAFMSSPVTTVSTGASICDAGRRMQREGVKHLPLTDDGVYLGLVSADHLAPYLTRHKVDVKWADDPMRIDSVECTEMTAPE